MEYQEPPNVKDLQRTYNFPKISWLDINYFKEIENKIQIHPNIKEADGRKMYIGKTVPDYSDNRNPMSLNEIIGAVIQDLDGNFSLKVPFDSTVFNIKENFVVLSIEDENSYHWIKDSNGHLPKFSLRGSICSNPLEFLYIGRSILNDSSAKFFQYPRMELLNQTVEPSFGKIHSSHNCLYVPLDDKELAFNEYEVLCLKPSPTTLKEICCSVIRNSLGQNAHDMKEKFQSKLPNELIKYLEYPVSLSYGEYMLKGEKILSKCGRYELLINNENKLICKDNKKNVIISETPNVQLFYLHQNKIVMCHSNGHSLEIFANINFNLKLIPNKYCFKFYTEDNSNSDSCLKYFLIEVFDNRGHVIHSEKIFRSIPININEEYDRMDRRICRGPRIYNSREFS